MTDDNAAANAGAANNQDPAAQQHHDPPKTYTQDDYNALDARLRREYDAKNADLKKKADEWDRQQEANKSEIQKERDARAKAEAERDSLKLSREREKWQAKHGRKNNIPETDWDRLRGSTESEIEEDARTWAKNRGLDKAGGPTPKGSGNQAPNPFNAAFLAATGRTGR